MLYILRRSTMVYYSMLSDLLRKSKLFMEIFSVLDLICSNRHLFSGLLYITIVLLKDYYTCSLSSARLKPWAFPLTFVNREDDIPIKNARGDLV